MRTTRGLRRLGVVALALMPLACVERPSGVVRLVGSRAGDRFGESICFVGDVDGDGVCDFAVGAPGVDGSGHPGSRFVQLSPIGDVDLDGTVDVLASGIPNWTEYVVVSMATFDVGLVVDPFGFSLGMNAIGGENVHGSSRPDYLVGTPEAEYSAGSVLLVHESELGWELPGK